MSAKGAAKSESLVTQYAYAKSRGISRQRINVFVQEGRLTLVRGKVDPVAADAQLADEIDPRHEKTSKVTKGAGGGSASSSAAARLRNAQADRYEAQARREKHDLGLRLGSVVDRKLVHASLFTLARTVRDALLNASPRFAAKAALETDRKKVLRLYRETVEGALRQLSVAKFEELLTGTDDAAD